ncbi:MAG: pirin family protein [Pseudomonadota bacterium]|nr:pirin family protein [Pseudomonadota bacterium]
MIKIRKSEERGRLKLNWLQARYSFSFANYHNAEYSGFRDLLVLNQDIVSPSGGFSTHAHSDMEIVTFIIRGTLEHKDSMGNKEQIHAGEVQRMSAGTGITHSEYNASDVEELELLQIWILPSKLHLIPSYEQKQIKDFKSEGPEKLLVSPAGEFSSLKINQDVKFFEIALKKGEAWERPIDAERGNWIQVIKGDVNINDLNIKTGDGVLVEKEENLSFRAQTEVELLLLDLC